MTEECVNPNGDKWTIYKDKASKWRWNCVATNGRTVGAATEGYVNKSDCISNARRNGMKCNPS